MKKEEDVEDGLLSKVAAFGSPQLFCFFLIKFADMALYFTLCYATLYFSASALCAAKTDCLQRNSSCKMKSSLV